MTQNALADAIDSLVAHRATEALQLFRRGTWLLTATMLPGLAADERRNALGLFPVATMADRVHHVAITTATINDAKSDAVSWLDVPVDPNQATAAPPRLVLYPYVQRPGSAIAWSDPVEMGAESAIFGDVTDAVAVIAPGLAGATPRQLDVARAAALDRLTQLDIAVEMSEEFSAEVHALLGRVG